MRVVLVALLLVAHAVGAQERPLPDYATFAAQVRTHLATDEERQSGYTFLERRVELRRRGFEVVIGKSSFHRVRITFATPHPTSTRRESTSQLY